MSDGTVSWFAGIDWGSEKHQVCLLDAAGKVVGSGHSGTAELVWRPCASGWCRSSASQAGSR